MLKDRVRELRLARGWTQEDLARQSGIGQSYIGGIESGRLPNPTHRTLAKLATAFDLSIPELLGQPTLDDLRDAGLPSEWVQQFARLEHRLTPEDREAVLKHALALAKTYQEYKGRGPKATRKGDGESGSSEPGMGDEVHFSEALGNTNNHK